MPELGHTPRDEQSPQAMEVVRYLRQVFKSSEVLDTSRLFVRYYCIRNVHAV